MSILAVSGSQGARLRGPSGSTGPRGKEIYCQTGGGPGGGNLALHILFTNESWDPGTRQGLINDHISQTDRMTSVFLLSDVDASLIYPNQN